MTPLHHLSRRRINRCETAQGDRLKLRHTAPTVDAWRARAHREAQHARGLYRAAAEVAVLGAQRAGVPPVASDVLAVARAPIGLRCWVEDVSAHGWGHHLPKLADLAHYEAARAFLGAYLWGADVWIDATPVMALPQALEDELARLGGEIEAEVDLAVGEYAEDLEKWREGHSRMWGQRRDPR